MNSIQSNTSTLEGRYPLKPYIYQALKIEGLYRKKGSFDVSFTRDDILKALEFLQEIDGTNDEQRFLIDSLPIDKMSLVFRE